MKYRKQLLINLCEFKIVSDCINLEVNASGRASFCAIGEHVEKGAIVKYYINETLIYSGFVESCKKIDGKQQRIFSRAFSAILIKRLPLAQRFTTAEKVLEEVSIRTGLFFIFKNIIPIPYFFNIGNGYDIFHTISKHLNIEDFVWFDYPNGNIFLGTRPKYITLNIPEKFFTDLSISAATCPLIETLSINRTIKIGDGEVLTIKSIQINNQNMRITF